MTTHADLDAAQFGGVVNEDVMQQIWDVSNVPLPFTDLMGSAGTHGNQRCEWVTDALQAPVTNNAAIDGADITGDQSKAGARLGNYTQIGTKIIKISAQSDASDSVGGMGSLSYQIKERQKELRRDIEAQMLTIQASVAGTNAVSGISAGFGAQLTTNINLGATGTPGGFDFTTGLFISPVPGTKRAGSETTLRDVLQSIYINGGNTSVAMARPPVIRKLSEYLFSATARVATLMSDNAQKGEGAMTAYGSVNVFVTDFGQTIRLVDNRLQPTDAAGTSTMYLIDPKYVMQSFLKGYSVDPLGKSGLAEKRLMSAHYSLKVLSEKAQGAIYAIDETLAWTA